MQHRRLEIIPKELKHYWKIVKTINKGKNKGQKKTILTSDKAIVDAAYEKGAELYDVGKLSSADIERYKQMGVEVVEEDDSK